VANLVLTPTWDEIRQLEITDAVEGGAGGVDNIAPRQLGNRSEYLERRLRCVGKVGDFMVMRCGGPILLGSGWSAHASGACWTWSGYSSTASAIIFPVPATNGGIVGASGTCVFYAASEANKPNVALAIMSIRETTLVEPTTSNYIVTTWEESVTDTANPWIGLRDLSISLPTEHATDCSASEYSVRFDTPRTNTSNVYSMSVLRPFVFIQP